MTSEQEAQQAQTITGIRERVKIANEVLSVVTMLRSVPAGLIEAHNDCIKLLEIVDSQAQKIAELTADKNVLNVALDIEQTDAEKLRHKIAEQAAKIKSMEENAGILAGAFYDEKEALGIQIAEQAKEIERLKRNCTAIVETNRQRG